MTGASERDGSIAAPVPDGTGKRSPAVLEQTWAALDERERRIATVCLVTISVLGVAGWVGLGSSLYLVSHWPLLLIALSPVNRHLILVAPSVDAHTFVIVAVARRLLSCLASFYLGRALGPAGLLVLETHGTRAARLLRWVERIFRRASAAAIVLLPGALVSVIAGTTRMRPALFVPLVTLGLVVRMLSIVALADWLHEPILSLLELIRTYWLPGTVLLLVWLVVYRRIRPTATLRPGFEPGTD